MRGKEETGDDDPAFEGPGEVWLLVAEDEETDHNEEVDDRARVAFDVENEALQVVILDFWLSGVDWMRRKTYICITCWYNHDNNETRNEME